MNAPRPAFSDARLYLCTDSRSRQGDLADFLDAVLGGGVDVVQLREKGLEARDELRLLEVVADAASTIEIIEIVRARELNAAVVRATREDATSASFLLRRRRTVALRRVGWSTKGANADSWRCEMLPASPVESGTAPKPRQRCSRG